MLAAFATLLVCQLAGETLARRSPRARARPVEERRRDPPRRHRCVDV